MDYYISYADWDLLNEGIERFANEDDAGSGAQQVDQEDFDFDDVTIYDNFGDGIFFDGPSDWRPSSSAHAGAAKTLSLMRDKLDDKVNEIADHCISVLISTDGICNIFDFPTPPRPSMGHEQWYMALKPQRVVQINESFQDFLIEDYRAAFESIACDQNRGQTEFTHLVDYVNMWKAAIREGAERKWSVIGSWG